MVSGNTASSMCTTPMTLVTHVKELVHEQASVPVEEQHLFANGQELLGDVPVVSLGVSTLSLARWPTNPLVTDLGHFHATPKFQPLPHNAFRRVKKLKRGIHGDVYLFAWLHEGHEDCVAVKKLRNESLEAALDMETDERAVHLEGISQGQIVEDPLAEIGILRFLARQPDLSPNLLRLRGVFAEDRHTWLVMDYAEGGELSGAVAAGPLAESDTREYSQQLLRAAAYLHGHGIAHRDISLENALLRRGRVQLADFGMAVRCRTSSGVPLRFFRMVGKGYHRAPEVYVPLVAKALAVTPANLPAATRTAMVCTSGGYLCELRFPPEAVPGKDCLAEVWGYAAAPIDVFAVGVCIFFLAWQCLPWRRALLCDNSFAFVRRRGDSGITDLLQHWQKPLLSPEAVQLITEMLRTDPTQRPSASACLASSWFGEEAMSKDREQPLAPEFSAVQAAPLVTPCRLHHLLCQSGIWLCLVFKRHAQSARVQTCPVVDCARCPEKVDCVHR